MGRLKFVLKKVIEIKKQSKFTLPKKQILHSKVTIENVRNILHLLSLSLQQT